MEEEESLCFVCCNGTTSILNAENNWRSRKNTAPRRLENNLDVIFILRNLLQVPSNELEYQLKECRDNPEDWISLCDQCIQLTDKARQLHQEIKTIERQLKLIYRQILEKITSSSTDHEEENGTYHGSSTEFVRKIRSIVKQNHHRWKNDDDDADALCEFLEGDKLASYLSSQSRQNSSTAQFNQFIMVEKPVDVVEEIKVEVEPLPSPSSPPPMSPSETDDTVTPCFSEHSIDNDEEAEEDSIRIPGKSKPEKEKMEVELSPSSFPAMSPHADEEEEVEEVKTLSSSESDASDEDDDDDDSIKIIGESKQDKGRRDPGKCRYCEKHFEDGPSLKNHMTLVHSTFQKYEPCICNCPYCGKQFRTRISLENHVKQVHINIPRRKTKCPLCEKGFKGNRDKNVHMLTKHKDDPVTLKLQEETCISLHKCPMGCRSFFLTTKDLDRHVNWIHPGVDKNNIGNSKSRITEDGKFGCGICGRVFDLPKYWSEHQWKRHNVEEVICPVVECGLVFKVENEEGNEFPTHWNTVHKKKRKKNTVDDKKEEKKGEGPWICEICGVEKFSWKSFHTHRSGVHKVGGKGPKQPKKNFQVLVNGKPVEVQVSAKEKEKKEDEPVLCNLCGKEMNKKYLPAHQRFVHEKSFNLRCPVCGLGAMTRGKLNMHLLTRHSEDPVTKQLEEKEGLKLSKCEVVGCKVTFSTKDKLDKHVEKVHQGGGTQGGGGGDMEATVKKFKCKYCGKGFWLGQRLSRHEATHEGKGSEDFKCEICGKGFGTKHYLGYHLLMTHKQAKKFQKSSAE